MTDDEQLFEQMRSLKRGIEQNLLKLDGPKADVTELKERVKSKLGLHRAGFDVARKYANKKLPEAQQWFDTVFKSAVAYGIWDQGDLLRMAQAAPHVPLPTATSEAPDKPAPRRGRPRRQPDDRPAA